MKSQWFPALPFGLAGVLALGASLTVISSAPAQQENPPDEAPSRQAAPENAPAQPERQAAPQQAQPNQPQAEQSQPPQDGQPPQPNADRPRAELGIAIAPSRGDGVLVARVRPDSAAEEAGVQAGDFIIAIRDQATNTPQQLIEMLSHVQPGQDVAVTVWRNGKEQTVIVHTTEQRQAGYRGEDEAEGQDLDPRRRGDRQPTAWLGVLLSDPPQAEQQEGDAPQEEGQQPQQGVVITRVYPSSPAARADLRSGDVIVSVGGEEVASAQDVANIIEQAQPGEETQLTVLRNGEKREITATLADSSNFLGSSGGGFGPRERMDGTSRGDGMAFVPQHAMLLEQHRRLAEQNQRLEGLIRNLTEEVQALRKDVQQLRGGRPDAEQ